MDVEKVKRRFWIGIKPESRKAVEEYIEKIIDHSIIPIKNNKNEFTQLEISRKYGITEQTLYYNFRKVREDEKMLRIYFPDYLADQIIKIYG